jgi:hypothetical protein
MREPRRTIVLLAGIFIAISAASAADVKAPIMLTPDLLQWTPNPAAPEVKMAIAWGDPQTGAHGVFHKFPAGFVAPLHTHSANTRIVVISGTMAIGDEQRKETRFPPGSYFTQPNTWSHTTSCVAGADCLIYTEVDGKWDLKPVAAK